MAGFLGFGNYSKEGPGISKDAPKKKTLFVFIETYFRNFWKFISINLVYSLMNVLIIPSGLASAGITHVARTIARDKHSFGLSDYFETVKKNWKQALIAGIINLIVYVLIVLNFIFVLSAQGWFAIICQGVLTAVAFIFLVMNFYIWTLLITFKFRLGQIYKNSFKFVFVNLKRNFLCMIILALVYAAAYGLLLLSTKFSIIYAFVVVCAICVFPAFRFLLIQFCTFPSIVKYIIDPYYKEHPHEDIELRKSLGLEIEEEENGEEEVFSDNANQSADE